MSKRLRQWVMACAALLLMGSYATLSHAIVVGDPDATVSGKLTVTNGMAFTGTLNNAGPILCSSEHRLFGAGSAIRFLPDVGGFNYIQFGLSSGDTAAKLRIARWGTSNGALSNIEMYTSQLVVSGKLYARDEIVLLGTLTNNRMLTGTDGIFYNQIGLNASDTNAKFRISRYATTASPISNFDVIANTTYLSGNVGIGTATPTVKLDVNGEAAVNVINIRGGSDISEKFDICGDVRPGYVVSIDPGKAGSLMVSSTPYDRKVAGIVSGAGGVNSGLSLGQPNTLATGKHAVAISGRVYCYADTSNGAIEPGDLLTTSATPGHVMKASNSSKAHGAIIGKAMTGLSSGKDLVLVLVNLQ